MLTEEEIRVIAVAERAKRLGSIKKHNKRLIERAEDIIEKHGLTQEQVEEIYQNFIMVR